MPSTSFFSSATALIIAFRVMVDFSILGFFQGLVHALTGSPLGGLDLNKGTVPFCILVLRLRISESSHPERMDHPGKIRIAKFPIEPLNHVISGFLFGDGF